MNRRTSSACDPGAPAPVGSALPAVRTVAAGVPACRPAALRANAAPARLIRIIALCFLLSPFSLLPSSARAEVAKEYRVKAAFLYNFTKFIGWPSDCFASARSPIVIAVLGHNPFEGELARVVHDRTVAGRPIALIEINPDSFAASTPPVVHVLFVPAGEEAQLHRLPGPPWGRGVVTVGESDHFAELGGIITFVLLNDRVHFEINAARAAAAGVTINAQLQKLATPAFRSARASHP